MHVNKDELIIRNRPWQERRPARTFQRHQMLCLEYMRVATVSGGCVHVGTSVPSHPGACYRDEVQDLLRGNNLDWAWTSGAG
jgi:hypothetical protein